MKGGTASEAEGTAYTKPAVLGKCVQEERCWAQLWSPDGLCFRHLQSGASAEQGSLQPSESASVWLREQDRERGLVCVCEERRLAPCSRRAPLAFRELGDSVVLHPFFLPGLPLPLTLTSLPQTLSQAGPLVGFRGFPEAPHGRPGPCQGGLRHLLTASPAAN